MAFIGWFLLTAARQEEAWVPTRESLAGLHSCRRHDGASAPRARLDLGGGLHP